MRDCLAVGHEKGRAVVRKKADALEAFEGVAIEGLRSHFSFLCQSSGMQRLPLDFPLFIRNLLGGEGTTMLYTRSEEHTSELQSLMRISYAVFCLKKKKQLTY